MPKTSTDDSLRQRNVTITDLLTMGTDAPIDFDEHSGAPGTPDSGKVRLYAKQDGRLYLKDDAGTEVALDETASGLAVLKSLFDAYTLLMATADDTPVALTIPEQTLVGRITGGAIAALTAANAIKILRAVITFNEPQTATEFTCGMLTGQHNRAAAGFTPAADTTYAWPVILFGTTTYDDIGINVDTLEVGTAAVLALYNDNGSGYPGDLYLDGGTVSLATTGQKINTGLANTPPAGLYWLSFHSDATGTCDISAENRDRGGRFPYGTSNIGANQATHLVKTSEAYTGTAIDPFPSGASGSTGNNVPRVTLGK